MDGMERLHPTKTHPQLFEFQYFRVFKFKLQGSIRSKSQTRSKREECQINSNPGAGIQIDSNQLLQHTKHADPLINPKCVQNDKRCGRCQGAFECTGM